MRGPVNQNAAIIACIFSNLTNLQIYKSTDPQIYKSTNPQINKSKNVKVSSYDLIVTLSEIFFFCTGDKGISIRQRRNR